jgi:hypothetical protein
MRWNLVCIVLCIGCQHHDATLPPIGDGSGAAVCPTHLDLELIGAESKFLPGFTGNAHGVGLANGSQFSVNITQCDAECRRCQFHGPVRGDPTVTPVIAQRCLGNSSIQCTADSDCAAVAAPYNVCRFMFPPISSMLGGVASCSLPTFEPVAMTDTSPVQGTIDLLTGEVDATSINLTINISLGTCQTCNNDAMPFDGVQGGTCSGSGAKACDIDGIIGTVSTSYDCGVAPDFKLALPGSETSTGKHVWTMDNNHPLCSGSGAPLHCWCGVCSDGTACSQDSDCATGTCGTAMGSSSETIRNNNCTSGCTWDPTTETGSCVAPVGTSCFPNLGSISATGVAEVHPGYYISQLANLECMPPTGNPGIDMVAGFPGPLLFDARFRVTTRTGP